MLGKGVGIACRDGASGDVGALREELDGHWVSSEVQEELQPGASRRNGAQKAVGRRERLESDDIGTACQELHDDEDALEVIVIQRRRVQIDPQFVDPDGDLDLPRAKKKPRRSSRDRRRERVGGEGEDSDPEARSAFTHVETLKKKSERAREEALRLRREVLEGWERLELLARPRTPWRVAGAQVWRAALLLAEFVDAKPELFTDAIVLELGCGVGLASIIASRTARCVFATDGDAQALVLAQMNVSRSCRFQSGFKESSRQQSSVDVPRCRPDEPAEVEASTAVARCVTVLGKCVPKLRVFNWDDRELPWRGNAAPMPNDARHPTEFAWTREDTDALNDLSIVIASDVLYDEDTGRAFLRAVQRVLLSSRRAISIVVALERRPVFSALTMSVVALGCDAFHEHLCLHDRVRDHVEVAANRVKCRQCLADATSSSMHDGVVSAPMRFVAREYPVDSIPHVLDYNRPSTLLVWIIDAVVVA